jgi:hypothetical protein
MILSLSDYCNNYSTNMFVFNNASLYYYDEYNSIWFYYFYVIENNIYVSDFEFMNMYNENMNNSRQLLQIREDNVFNYDNFLNKYKLNSAILIKNIYNNTDIHLEI